MSQSDFAAREAALDRINDDPTWAQQAYGAPVTGPNYIYRIVYRMADGSFVYGLESGEPDHVQVYFDSVKESIPNPSQKEVWIERRLVTQWERCS